MPETSATEQQSRRVAMLTLGCARNEVDSEELAGRLSEEGWELAHEPDTADVVVVNTCAFVEQAKKDSVDTLLAASDTGAKVVAVGCMAERYGEQLAESLPEADAVLGFDAYPRLGRALAGVVEGEAPASHTPTDRRKLLPLSPVSRPEAAAEVSVPGHAWGPASTAREFVTRRRLSDSPVAALKLASGCDRRCSFCAIPSFRGSFVSRPPADLLAEAQWLGRNGAKELFLVSENSTSYGKDLPASDGGRQALELLLPKLAAVPGVGRVRVSYLQPAEIRPELLRAIASTEGVAPYFDLSFQHAAPEILRAMRRFGGTEPFLRLLDDIRQLAPEAGVRSNFIVGFPGETEQDLQELEEFLGKARLDAIGIFGYSDEDGTEAEGFPDKLDPMQVSRRVDRLTQLAEQLTAARAAERIGERVAVLVEGTCEDTGAWTGRAAHQAPEVDGECTLTDGGRLPRQPEPGETVLGEVVDTVGVDLVVEPAALLEGVRGS